MQQIAHADGGDHDGHSGGGAQRLVGCPLDQKAQQDGEQDGQRQGDGQGQPHGGQVDGDQAGDHEHVAVGEVDQAQNTVHHGVADGDQGVLTSHGDAGEQYGNSIFHKGFLPCCRIWAVLKRTLPLSLSGRPRIRGRAGNSGLAGAVPPPNRHTAYVRRSGTSPESRRRRRCHTP